MCGILAKWVSVVERLGEGRLRGLSGPYPSMTDASVPLAEAPFPFNLIDRRDDGTSASSRTSHWRRYRDVLAQVTRVKARLR